MSNMIGICEEPGHDGSGRREGDEHAPNHKFQMRSRDVLNTTIGDPHTVIQHGRIHDTGLTYLAEGQSNPCHFPREQAGNR